MIDNNVILHWNCANGIFNKMNVIKDKIAENNPEVFFISESNISNNMNLDLLNISEYNFTTSNTISFQKSRICAFYKNGWDQRDGLK